MKATDLAILLGYDEEPGGSAGRSGGFGGHPGAPGAPGVQRTSAIQYDVERDGPRGGEAPSGQRLRRVV